MTSASGATANSAALLTSPSSGPEPGGGLSDDAAAVFRRGDVAGERDRLARLRRRLLRGGEIAADDRHPGSGGAERAHNRATEPARAAADKDGFS